MEPMTKGSSEPKPAPKGLGEPEPAPKGSGESELAPCKTVRIVVKCRKSWL